MIKLNKLTENKNTQPNLNEGLGDAISKIRNLAIKIADKKAGNAVKHLNLDKISKDKPDAKSAMNKAQSVLSKQTGMNEDLKSTINKFAVNVGSKSALGAIISAVLTAGSWAQYAEASFAQWYYTEIQRLAEPEVMRVMQDIYGAQAAEGSLWAKLGMYAFFIFFTISVVMFVSVKITQNRKNENSMIKLQSLLNEESTSKTINEKEIYKGLKLDTRYPKTQPIKDLGFKLTDDESINIGDIIWNEYTGKLTRAESPLTNDYVKKSTLWKVVKK